MLVCYLVFKLFLIHLIKELYVFYWKNCANKKMFLTNFRKPFYNSTFFFVYETNENLVANCRRRSFQAPSSFLQTFFWLFFAPIDLGNYRDDRDFDPVIARSTFVHHFVSSGSSQRKRNWYKRMARYWSRAGSRNQTIARARIGTPVPPFILRGVAIR